MQGLVDKWNVSHLLDVITTDKASNMVGIFNQPDFPTTYSSGVCFNHVLQRVIEVGEITISSLRGGGDCLNSQGYYRSIVCNLLQFIGCSLNKPRINIWNIWGEKCFSDAQISCGGGGGFP